MLKVAVWNENIERFKRLKKEKFLTKSTMVSLGISW